MVNDNSKKNPFFFSLGERDDLLKTKTAPQKTTTNQATKNPHHSHIGSKISVLIISWWKMDIIWFRWGQMLMMGKILGNHHTAGWWGVTEYKNLFLGKLFLEPAVLFHTLFFDKQLTSCQAKEQNQLVRNLNMLLYNSQGLLVLIISILIDHSLCIAFEFNATVILPTSLFCLHLYYAALQSCRHN